MDIKGYLQDTKKSKALPLFGLVFVLSAMCFMLCAALGDGLFLFFGDYNFQQIPFYYHVHELVRSGHFGWDFATDLGSDLFESYTFYLLGSPFFWLTIPFPNESLPYLMPWFLALKTAVAALTAYIYIGNFTKNTNAAALGGLLYSFSGFMVYSLLFNHFHDPVCLFPLLLYTSDKLFMEKKRGLFALMVGLCAVTNYYFFFGMVVFTVMYFVINVICGRYRFTLPRFVLYGAEAVLGVVCAAVILIPSADSVLSNSRTTDFIRTNPLIYSNEPLKYLYILKSMFTVPDIPLIQFFPVSDELSSANVTAYLPFVGICGVIGYFFAVKEKRDTLKLTFAASCVCMLVPFLNSLFSAMNQQYYARWYFCPILIMCAMTAVTADRDITLMKKGIIPGICAAGAVIIAALVYKLNSGEANAMIQAGDQRFMYILYCTVLPIGCMALMYSLFRDKSLDTSAKQLGAISVRCAAVGVITTCVPLVFSHFILTNQHYKGIYISDSAKVKEIAAEDCYYRIDNDHNAENVGIMWNRSSVQSFISLVHPSISQLMSELGFERGTHSQIPPNYMAYRCLLSVRYYFDTPYYLDDGTKREPFEHPIGLDIYTYKTSLDDLVVYENDCYIPMGFTYDTYTTDEALDALDNRALKMQGMLEAVVLTDEQAALYSDILEPYDTANAKYDTDRLREICASKHSCDYFTTDRSGFDAAITLDEDRLLFISIPYDEDWHATINGAPVRIEKVNYGLMAVRCGKGENIIRFDYKNRHVQTGALISLCGVMILVIYICVPALVKKMKKGDNE
ncbi:MAG: YfhO family protein [Oscillospiraceae bacterium]|nr:YfhO family protein [Oscillospiraceae bacterium]